MGLESLFAFTMLGGLAAGAYVFETVLRKTREGDRPWLVPLVVVVLFAAGLIAAATHVHSFAHAFDSLFSGTVNFGAGMVHEVAVSGLFFVLALIDLIVTFAKKGSPFALRVVTAIVALVCIVLMGAAYIDILGNSVWCNAPATVISFVGGGLAMGLALFAVLDSEGFSTGISRVMGLIVNIVLAVGIALEIMAFSDAGLDPMMQIVALVIAPAASCVLLGVATKASNARMIAIAICVLTVVGVAISRWAFYATSAMM